MVQKGDRLQLNVTVLDDHDPGNVLVEDDQGERFRLPSGSFEGATEAPAAAPVSTSRPLVSAPPAPPPLVKEGDVLLVAVRVIDGHDSGNVLVEDRSGDRFRIGTLAVEEGIHAISAYHHIPIDHPVPTVEHVEIAPPEWPPYVPPPDEAPVVPAMDEVKPDAG